MAKEKKEAATADSTPSPQETQENLMYENPDRDSLYAEYERSTNPQPTESAPAEAETESSDESHESETAPVEAETDETEEDVKEKTVPLAALHEEREKRKAIQAQLRELSSQIENLKNQKLEEDKNKNILSLDEEINDFEAELKRLRQFEADALKKIETLDKSYSQIIEKDKKAIAEQAQAHLNSRINKTASELENDGFPGFNMFTSQIRDELDKLIQEDPDNISWDREEGWKKIYKNKIFPQVKKLFVKHDVENILVNKKAKKESANLASVSSNIERSTEQSDDWTKEDYLKMRMGG